MRLTAGSRVRARGQGVMFVAVLFLLCAPVAPSLVAARSGTPMHGSLVAVFAMKQEIVLMSDGRAVNPEDGAVVRDDLPKVYRLTSRAAVLTAGRILPNLMASARSRLARGSSAGLLGEVAAVRDALQSEWEALASTGEPPTRERTFVFVAGLDEHGPRVFYFDTRRAPEIPVNEIGVLQGGRDLDVVAIASNPRGSTDASDVIVRHVSAISGSRRGLSRRATLIAAFKAAQDEISSYDPRIGGETFAAVIDHENGYQAVDAGG